jgi:hypothetical protein
MIDFSKMKKGNKAQPLPGTTTGTSDKKCPMCGALMEFIRPCCGANNGGLICPNDGYKVLYD